MARSGDHRIRHLARWVATPTLVLAAGLVILAVYDGRPIALAGAAVIALVAGVVAVAVFDVELIRSRRAHGADRAAQARSYASIYAAHVRVMAEGFALAESRRAPSEPAAVVDDPMYGRTSAAHDVPMAAGERVVVTEPVVAGDPVAAEPVVAGEPPAAAKTSQPAAMEAESAPKVEAWPLGAVARALTTTAAVEAKIVATARAAGTARVDGRGNPVPDTEVAASRNGGEAMSRREDADDNKAHAMESSGAGRSERYAGTHAGDASEARSAKRGDDALKDNAGGVERGNGRAKGRKADVRSESDRSDEMWDHRDAPTVVDLMAWEIRARIAADEKRERQEPADADATEPVAASQPPRSTSSHDPSRGSSAAAG